VNHHTWILDIKLMFPIKGYDVIMSKRARGKIVVKVGEDLGGATG
jgi:hypothetical protein